MVMERTDEDEDGEDRLAYSRQLDIMKTMVTPRDKMHIIELLGTRADIYIQLEHIFQIMIMRDNSNQIRHMWREGRLKKTDGELNGFGPWVMNLFTHE